MGYNRPNYYEEIFINRWHCSNYSVIFVIMQKKLYMQRVHVWLFTDY